MGVTPVGGFVVVGHGVDAGPERLVGEKLRGAVVEVGTDHVGIQVGIGIADRADHPDGGLLEHVSRDAGDEGVLAVEIAVVIEHRPDHANIVIADAAGDLGREIDRHRPSATGQSDAPAEKRGAGQRRGAGVTGAELKDAGVLEEEVALLRVHQRKAGEVELAGVDLRLGKVGVHGERRIQVGGEAVGNVTTKVAHRVTVSADVIMLVFPDEVGGDLPFADLAQAVETPDLTGVGHGGRTQMPSLVVPLALLVFPADSSLNVESPRVVVRGKSD